MGPHVITIVFALSNENNQFRVVVTKGTAPVFEKLTRDRMGNDAWVVVGDEIRGAPKMTEILSKALLELSRESTIVNLSTLKGDHY